MFEQCDDLGLLVWIGTFVFKLCLSKHRQTSITAAGDHVADLSPRVQVRVIDFHRVDCDRGRKVSAGSPASDCIKQPVNRWHWHACACGRHGGHFHPFLLRHEQGRRAWTLHGKNDRNNVNAKQCYFTSSGQYFSTVSSAPSASFQPPTA